MRSYERDIISREESGYEGVDRGILLGKPLLCGSHSVFYVADGDEETEDTGWVRVIRETIGQYTGFDWKGKKLFDGDILRLEEDTDEGTEISYLVIEWIKEWGLWGTLFTGEYKGYQDQGTAALDESMIWTYTLESTDEKKYFLCGNIHDNPELLK